MRTGKHKQAFKLTETARLIRAAHVAGLNVVSVTLGSDGKPVLVTERSADAPQLGETVRDTSWDDLKPDAQEQKRPA
jgi:hypothetical protein